MNLANIWWDEKRLASMMAWYFDNHSCIYMIIPRRSVSNSLLDFSGKVVPHMPQDFYAVPAINAKPNVDDFIIFASNLDPIFSEAQGWISRVMEKIDDSNGCSIVIKPSHDADLNRVVINDIDYKCGSLFFKIPSEFCKEINWIGVPKINTINAMSCPSCHANLSYFRGGSLYCKSCNVCEEINSWTGKSTGRWLPVI